MTQRGEASFQVTSWDEKPYEEHEGGTKLTRAHVTQAYRGIIEGSGSVEYLMFHRADQTANFIGLERITGAVAGRKGSFVAQHEGQYDEGIAKSRWFVVEGSGTLELTGMHGRGSYSVGHDGKASVQFEFDFDGVG